MIYANLFDKIRQFVELSADEEEIIRRLFVPRRLVKGEYFLRAGEVCQTVVFIEFGIFRHFLSRDEGEFIYAFAAENDFVSDYESFLSGNPTDKNIQAVEDASVLVITRDDLQEFYKNLRSGERFGRLILEQLFVANLRQIVSLYQNTPAERYRQFSEIYRHIQNRVPQYYIASYVGVRPESLSRIRRRALNSRKITKT